MTWKPIPASSTRIITTGVDNVCNVAILINSGGQENWPNATCIYICCKGEVIRLRLTSLEVLFLALECRLILGNWPRNCVCVRDEEIAILARVSQFEKQNKKRVVRKKIFSFLFQRTVVCRMRS